MGIIEVHAFVVQCEMWLRDESNAEVGGHLCPSRVGPIFADRQTQISLPAGWIKKRYADCGMTGYSTSKIYCPDCVRRFKLKVMEQ